MAAINPLSTLLSLVAPGAMPVAPPGTAPATPGVNFATVLTPLIAAPGARHDGAGDGKDLPDAPAAPAEDDDPLLGLVAPLLPPIAHDQVAVAPVPATVIAPGVGIDTAASPDLPVSVAAVPDLPAAGDPVPGAAPVVDVVPADPAPSVRETPVTRTVPTSAMRVASPGVATATPVTPAPAAPALAAPASAAPVSAVVEVAPALVTRAVPATGDRPVSRFMPLPTIDAPAPASPVREVRLPRRIESAAPAVVVPARAGVAVPIVVDTPASMPARVAPAAQVFAGAIRQVLRDEGQPARTVPATIVATTTDLAVHAVTAAHETQGPPLDTRRGDWPERMIERIEVLRDAANAQDTRIRLIPDALGPIDVSLKREGDAVQVQFTAAQPETRQLLIDAQPRLEALGEARGIRLAQGASGGAGDPGQPQRQHQPAQGAAPRAAAAAHDESSTDHRIA